VDLGGEVLKRMRHIAIALHKHLKLPYGEDLAILKQVAPHFGDFKGMLFPDYVEVYGLDDYELSMDALEEVTRPFIIRYPKRAMAHMLAWSTHENEHVRRLASEGCRPRLPWAMALPDFKADPAPILPILENLKNDPSLYVRRSVANNLNDITKDNKDIVYEIADRWMGDNDKTDWIIKHACRGLLKKGEARAMRLFGFGDPVEVRINQLAVTEPIITIGDDQFFTFELENLSAADMKIKLDYSIDFVKKTGKVNNKVFNLTENTYASGSTAFKRKQPFRNFSTRTHYPGKHTLYIIVNGEVKASVDFEVKAV